MADNIDVLPNDESISEDLLSHEDQDTTDHYIEMHPGTPMELIDTYRVTASKETKFIIIAGSVASGKTALLSSIYHLLYKCSIDDIVFSGSLTLKGFEERSAGIRISSGNSNPELLHTPSFTKLFLHLCLYNKKVEQYSDLLLSDISGEDYRDLIANTDLAQEEYSFIKRTDFFILLINGENISSPKSRHSEKYNCDHLLRTLIDAKVLLNTTKLFIVFNKLDLIVDATTKDATLSKYITKMKNEFKDKYGSAFSSIVFYEIAALPKDTKEYKVGHNVNHLVTDWTSDYNLGIQFKQSSVTGNHSSFDLFGQSLYRGNCNERN